MKKLLVSLLLLSSLSIFAQDNDDHHDRDRKDHQDDSRNNNAPDNVQQSFQRDNPNARNAHWENSNGRWHSTYKDKDDRDGEAYYDNDGRRIDSRLSYNETELPEGLRERLRRRYHDNYRVFRLDRPGQPVLFQVTLGDGTISFYDENGRRRRYRDEH